MKPFEHGCMSPMEKELRHHQMTLNAMRELDDFKICITELVENYIRMLDTKISVQDLKVAEAEEFMKTKITEVTTNFVNKLFQEGKIVLDLNYDPETESLYVGGELIG